MAGFAKVGCSPAGTINRQRHACVTRKLHRTPRRRHKAQPRAERRPKTIHDASAVTLSSIRVPSTADAGTGDQPGGAAAAEPSMRGATYTCSAQVAAFANGTRSMAQRHGVRAGVAAGHAALGGAAVVAAPLLRTQRRRGRHRRAQRPRGRHRRRRWDSAWRRGPGRDGGSDRVRDVRAGSGVRRRSGGAIAAPPPPRSVAASGGGGGEGLRGGASALPSERARVVAGDTDGSGPA